MAKRLVFVVDDEIHSMFKNACRERGVGQQKTLRDLVEQFICISPVSDVPEMLPPPVEQQEDKWEEDSIEAAFERLK